jgi:hypothetical protein
MCGRTAKTAIKVGDNNSSDEKKVFERGREGFNQNKRRSLIL